MNKNSPLERLLVYHAISAYKRALRPDGIYVVTGGSTAQMFEAMLLGPWVFMTGGKKQGNLAAKPNKKDLSFVKDLIETITQRCKTSNSYV